MNQIRQRTVDINVPPIRDISVSSVVLLCLRRALAYPNQSVSKLMYPQDQVDVVQNAMECKQSQNPPSQKSDANFQDHNENSQHTLQGSLLEAGTTGNHFSRFRLGHVNKQLDRRIRSGTSFPISFRDHKWCWWGQE